MGRAHLVAVAALVPALAAGCGDAPTAKFAPPPSSPSSPAVPGDPATTSAADVMPPVMPELAKQHTVAGAKAFVNYVIASLNFSETASDETTLKPLFSDACYVCQAAPDTIARIRRHHGVIAGGVIDASGEEVERLSARLVRVTFRYHSTRQTVSYPSGRRTVYRDGSLRVAWTLSERPGGWLIVGWDQP